MCYTPSAMSDAARVMEWNGRDLPEALRELPPGTYTLERVEAAEEAGLTPEEEEGIRLAMAQVERGETVPWETVRAEIEARLSARLNGPCGTIAPTGSSSP